MSEFVHLHVHSEFSLLDGACRIKELITQAKKMGQEAIALTDHGVMYGVVDFYEAAVEAGIKPLIGCEVYTAPRSRFNKESGYDNEYGHLVLIAKDNRGYQNLIKIVSAGFTEGFYYKPRIDDELLTKYNGGIIALSACLAGDIPRLLLSGDYEGAKKRCLKYLEIFGENNFYLELQDHGILEQKKLNPLIIRLSEDTGVALVATNDVHYIKREDAQYQDILLCIQTAREVNDEDRMKFFGEEFYLKSAEEMEQLFAFAPQALANTKKIADMCNTTFEFGKLKLPKYPAPKEAAEYLTELCQKGLDKRYSEITAEIRDRLDYELSVIKNMGFVDYFLIVWDYVNYAKKNNIVVGPGRGSAAGSIVAYALEITDIDPIKYNLIFERFLNPERISMPDIDIDFCYERRQEVIDYVISKYGADHVAQIITFGTMAARAVVRDAGRAMGIPYGEVDTVAKMIPTEIGITLGDALIMNPDLKTLCDADNKIAKLLEVSQALEGLPRHASTHAAGVVISGKSVDEYVPLQKNDDVITTQFPMGTLEKLGLLKMDFLGLRNLTVIRNTVEMAGEAGIVIDMENLDYDKQEVYTLIGRGETDGVFQLESNGMKSFMKRLAPENLEDIIAGISLYRPGPMDQIPKYIENKHNPQKIKYKHPLLENILDVTDGCIVYQEQVMQIVRDLGGYSMARADSVRKAMSKKKIDVMEKERAVFCSGAGQRGVNSKIANEIYDDMIDFAKYAFNKSHAAAYAVLAYQTAYLKTYYKTYFFAALFNSIIDNTDKVAGYFGECGRLNISVLPPHINHSKYRFTADGNNIRFGLGAVRNVGRSFAEEIFNEREKNGEFTSPGDFIRRMTGKDINKRAVSELIYSGALDNMGYNRAQMQSAYELIMAAATYDLKHNAAGQTSLFDIAEDNEIKDDYPNIKEYNNKTLLSYEKEAVGIYVTGHPLDEYRPLLEKAADTKISEIKNEEENFDKRKVKIAGMVASRKNKITKNNSQMAFVTFEDLSGSIEIIVFPKTLMTYDSLLSEESPLLVEGRVDERENEIPKILAEYFRVLKSASKITIEVSDGKYIDKLRPFVIKAKGDDELCISIMGNEYQCAYGVNAMQLKSLVETAEGVVKVTV